jgi:hypothetical protein
MVVYRQPRGLISRSRLVDAVRTAAARLGRGARLSEPGDGYMREVSEGSDPRRACFFHDYDGPADVRGELEKLFASVSERQDELADEAISVGERVYAEKPKAFVGRMRSYWMAWR